MNPLDLPGPAFLAFYSFALFAAHFAGKALAALCRGRHADDASLPDNLPAPEAAYLAGGTARAVDAALVQLLRAGLIAPKAGSGFALKGDRTDDAFLPELQKELYRQIARGNGDIEDLHGLPSAFLARARVRLAGDGLLMDGSSAEALCGRAAKCVPVGAVFALGSMKVAVGLGRHRPVALLVVFLIVSAAILLVKWVKLPPRSARGEQVLDRLKQRNAALEVTVRRGGVDVDNESLALAVALFGTQVLAGSAFGWMQPGFAARKPGSSDSGGSSSGCGGGGDGGGGGGGCGGCGG